jgi:hypothetical protein
MNPIVETVREVYCTGTNEYQRVWFEHYIVYLEGHDEPYKMTKKMIKDVDFVPRVGDKITCVIDEGRLKQVKLLIEHNP